MASRQRLSEDELLQMTDALLERRARRRRGSGLGVALATVAGVVLIAIVVAALVWRSPTVARLAPLVLTSPRLAVEAVFSNTMTFSREVVQALLLQELAGRGVALKEPSTRLVPPDQIVLRGEGPDGPVQIELRAVATPDGRWFALVRGLPGTTGEQRLDPAGRMAEGTTIKRVTVEPQQVVVELAD